MPLLHQEGLEDMREFLNKNADKLDPEYARGLFQELVDQLEGADINTTLLLQETLTYVLEGRE